MKRAYEDVDLGRRLRSAGLKTYQVQGALGACHDRYTIGDLAGKTIRNWGWSLDPFFPGDASLRRLTFFATIKHFVIMSLVRMVANVRDLKLKLVPIDFTVIAFGIYLIIRGNLSRVCSRRR